MDAAATGIAREPLVQESPGAKFRQLDMPTSCQIDQSRQALLADFLGRFKGQIRYQPIGDRYLRLFLSSLDFFHFKAVAKELESQADDDAAKLLINEIVSAIGAIGSYGVRAGKRVYVDYQGERKVKDRRGKTAQRKKARADVNPARPNPLPPQHVDQIICGDSLDVLKQLPNNCVDLVFTSPPYNFGLDYSQTEDAQDWDAYFKQLFAIFGETCRVLKHGGRLVVNVQPLFSDYIPTHHIISKQLMDIGMLWKGEILWEKNNYNCKYTAWGSWKSPSSPYLKYSWEFLEVFCKGSLKHEGCKTRIDISGDEFKKWVYAKWSIAPERNMEEYGHPAMFPEALAERVIKLFSFQDDAVLDVFNGVGTTTAVAKKLKRRYLGIDISEKYCRIAEERAGMPVQDELHAA